MLPLCSGEVVVGKAGTKGRRVFGEIKVFVHFDGTREYLTVVHSDTLSRLLDVSLCFCCHLGNARYCKGPPTIRNIFQISITQKRSVVKTKIKFLAFRRVLQVLKSPSNIFIVCATTNSLFFIVSINFICFVYSLNPSPLSNVMSKSIRRIDVRVVYCIATRNA